MSIGRISPFVWALPEIGFQDPTEKICTVELAKRLELLKPQHSLGHFGSEHLVKTLVYQGLYWQAIRKKQENGYFHVYSVRDTIWESMAFIHFSQFKQ